MPKWFYPFVQDVGFVGFFRLFANFFCILAKVGGSVHTKFWLLYWLIRCWITICLHTPFPTHTNIKRLSVWFSQPDIKMTFTKRINKKTLPFSVQELLMTAEWEQLQLSWQWGASRRHTLIDNISPSSRNYSAGVTLAWTQSSPPRNHSSPPRW